MKRSEPHERALDAIEGFADKWMADAKIVETIKNVVSVARLNTSAPDDVREKFIARAEACIDALVRQTFIEAYYRGWCDCQDTAGRQALDSAE